MGWCLRVDRERDLRVAAGCSVPEIAIRRLFFFKNFFVAWISLALCLSLFGCAFLRFQHKPTKIHGGK